MNRGEVIEFVKTTDKKLNSFIPGQQLQGDRYEHHAEARMLMARLWLQEFSRNFKIPTSTEAPEDNDNVDVEAIHNDAGKLAYKISYLENLTKRLINIGKEINTPYCQTALANTINYLIEAKLLYEEAKIRCS